MIKKFLATVLLWTTCASAGLPPTNIQGQSDTTPSTKFSFQVPKSQYTNLGGIKALIETGNKNYIADPGIENPSGPTTWATYNDGASNIPVDCTGGTATNLTLSRTTSTPLHGTASLLMTQANSTSLQGKGASYAFTIDSGDQAKVFSIQYDYNASSTFVASNGTTAPLNDGTTTTNAGNSDVETFIYDVTNAVLIPVTPQVITASGSNNFTFKGTFQTASNSTSYRVCQHIATTSANAAGWTFKADDFFVGPQVVVQGSPISNSTAYTPTIVGNGTVTNESVFYIRAGDRLEAWGSYTTGTCTATAFSIPLPTGMTIDYTKISTTTNNQTVGSIIEMTSTTAYAGSANGPIPLFVDGTTTGSIFAAAAPSGGALTKTNGNGFFNNNVGVSFHFSVPILGWSSTTQMSNDSDGRIVAARLAGTTQSPYTTDTALIFPTVNQDTHSAYNASTGVYTVPVSGFYQVNTYVNPSAGGGAGLSLYVALNGTAQKPYMGIEPTANNPLAGSTLVFAKAGDTIDVRANGGWTTSSPNTGLTIQRVSGTSAISTTDSVSAAYGLTSSYAASANAAIKYDTKVRDTHNAYSTSTGLYTIPIAGMYSLCTTTDATASAPNFYIAQNGTGKVLLFSAITGFANGYGGNCVTYPFSAGDTTGIYMDAAKTLTAPSSGMYTNFFSITRTGN